MPLILRPLQRAPTLLRRRQQFSTTPNPKASILFALHALSNSRETQHFNKISKLARKEHSPTLKLIETSEIDPYPLPSKPPVVIRPFIPSTTSPSAATPSWFHDRKALLVGRAILSSQARSQRRLERALNRTQIRASKLEEKLEVERGVWEREKRKQDRELKAAGAWIVVAVGVATFLGAWRVWPEGRTAKEVVRKGVEGGKAAVAEVGDKVAKVTPVGGGAGRGVDVVNASASLPIASAAPVVVAATEIGAEKGMSAEVVKVPAERSWWKGLFWVQS